MSTITQSGTVLTVTLVTLFTCGQVFAATENPFAGSGPSYQLADDMGGMDSKGNMGDGHMNGMDNKGMDNMNGGKMDNGMKSQDDMGMQNKDDMGMKKSDKMDGMKKKDSMNGMDKKDGMDGGMDDEMGKDKMMHDNGM